MNKLIKTLIVVLLPVLIVLSSVRLLATDQYLALEYGKASFPADSFGYTQQQRSGLASLSLHYVLAHTPGDALSTQTLNGTPVYSQREVSHMADVRTVFQSILRVWHLGFLLLLFLAVVLWESEGLQEIASAAKVGGLITAGMITAIAVLAVFAWQTWFELFHRFIFAPGSWLFAYSDTLIRLFPVKFWSDATLTVSALSLAGGLILGFAGWRISPDATS